MHVISSTITYFAKRATKSLRPLARTSYLKTLASLISAESSHSVNDASAYASVVGGVRVAEREPVSLAMASVRTVMSSSWPNRCAVSAISRADFNVKLVGDRAVECTPVFSRFRLPSDISTRRSRRRQPSRAPSHTSDPAPTPSAAPAACQLHAQKDTEQYGRHSRS